MKNFDMNKVKLVIWDLDETFWRGTISEGDVFFVDENTELVRHLTDCGIINSICSKNDYEVAKEKLVSASLWELFVCPSINWESKGNRAKLQISDLQLRAENVLFVDDNASNINEVRYYNPGIMTASAEEIPDIIRASATLERKDTEHKRLGRYKIIEEKLKKRAESGSNTEFLRECNIRVEIFDNCEEEAERLHELLQRTNQLNYTKVRATLEEMRDDFKNPECTCGYVKVSDNYGDYGIVGYYCLEKDRLRHFSFSCRCLGMGVEQYVYAKLGFPKFDVTGEVAVALDGTTPDWINTDSDTQKRAKDEVESDVRILLKGPCDMSQIFSFIEEGENIECEFTYTSPGGVAIEQTNHTQFMLESLSCSDEMKRKIIDELPFGDEAMFSQKMFSEKYNVIFFSTLTDCGLGVYRRKSGEYVVFGEYIHPLTDEREWDGYINGTIPNSNCPFSREQLEYIKENYEYIGRIGTDAIVENIKKILEKLDEKTHLVLILGSEIPYRKNDNENYNDRHIFHKELNDKIKALCESEKRLGYIEFTKHVKSQNDFFNNINHFMKNVYYDVSKEMISLIKELSDVTVVRRKRSVMIKAYAKQFIKRILGRE